VILFLSNLHTCEFARAGAGEGFTEEAGTAGDCEFIPGASLELLSGTAMGGRFLRSTVDSTLALAGAGTKRNVPSEFFFKRNFPPDSTGPSRGAKNTNKEKSTTIVSLMVE